MTERRLFRVAGLVQGVGFRPFVYGLATRLGLNGHVLNDAAGVAIEAQGLAAVLDAFAQALTAEAPPLARIDALTITPIPASPATGFIIRASQDGAAATSVTPDAAPCPDCLREMFDPADRRWRHPFISCTHCGPRHTITARLPYDRPHTSMAGFPLCPACAAEYHDPTDRRFHAQPIACPACGPRLSLPIDAAARVIADGGVLALKGVGGFQLLCDARRPDTVARLRAAKQRDGKPFAVMALNAADAATLVALDPTGCAALTDRSRPILIAPRRAATDLAPALAPDLAPNLSWLGVCLPASPLHYLLFHQLLGAPAGSDWLEQPCGLVLVCTSANPGGEPLCIDDSDAAARLAGIADAICGHDRPIVARADDSVLRILAGAPRLIRRGRGFTPDPIALACAAPPILALGGQLKNAVCMLRGREAFLSQHVGGLDDPATRRFQRETVAHLLRILDVAPELIACDAHPDSAATRWAEEIAAARDLPLIRIQHHAAHIYAVMAEQGISAPTLGLALDGYGYGDDGGAWGGELMQCGPAGWTRLGALAEIPLPGGDRAAREPWRMAAAALHLLGRHDEIAARFPDQPLAPALAALLRAGKAPTTSSLGRWFDAACGLLGVSAVAGYEGEAPMALESLVTTPIIDPAGWRIDGDRLDLTPLVARLTQVNAAEGAALFHGTLAAALIDWTAAAAARLETRLVVLAGGCMMNGVLATLLVEGCAARGQTPLLARRAPSNDGGLALGQAWGAALIASHR